jgi:hypothetical protein
MVQRTGLIICPERLNVLAERFLPSRAAAGRSRVHAISALPSQHACLAETSPLPPWPVCLLDKSTMTILKVRVLLWQHRSIWHRCRQPAPVAGSICGGRQRGDSYLLTWLTSLGGRILVPRMSYRTGQCCRSRRSGCDDIEADALQSALRRASTVTSDPFSSTLFARSGGTSPTICRPDARSLLRLSQARLAWRLSLAALMEGASPQPRIPGRTFQSWPRRGRRRLLPGSGQGSARVPGKAAPSVGP